MTSRGSGFDPLRLKELAEKATPGPWRVELSESDPRDDMTPVVVMKDNESGKWWDVDSTLLSEEDAAYIAAVSPDVVLVLLEAVVAAWLVDSRSERLGRTEERTEEDWDDLVAAFKLKREAFARIDFRGEGLRTVKRGPT